MLMLNLEKNNIHEIIMITLSILFFSLASVLGMLILYKWLTKKNASRAVILSHGGIAFVGLLLLLTYSYNNPDSFPKFSIIFFALAVISGLYIFINSLKNKTSPMIYAFFHAFLAVLGIVSLIVFVVLK